ncbi:MAG: hypothetical protein EOP58_15310, partial [Sphingomonadales bacterium]
MAMDSIREDAVLRAHLSRDPLETLSRRARTTARPFHATALFALFAGVPALLIPGMARAQEAPPA